ncbi:MAG TPA: TolC family protein [Syntrophorhabdaceae bacterium]|nr:TolC family protein [Syntrophorhabdaceae bacterium]
MRQHHHYSIPRKLICALCAIYAIFFIPLLCMAVENARTVTLDQALQITLEKNRDIQKAEEYRNKVKGIYVEQRAAALPQLTATASIGRSWDSSLEPVNNYYRSENRNLELTLTQPIFTWGQVDAAIRAAKFGIASADDQLRIYRQAALRDVSAAFYDALLAKDFYEIAKETLGLKIRDLDQTQRKFNLGVATEYDMLAARVAVENAKPDTIRTENQIRTTRERVRFLLGIEEEIDVAGRLDSAIEQPEKYEQAFENARKKRPELAELRNRLGLYSELVTVAAAGNKPRVDLKASTGYRDLHLGHNDLDGKTWSVGLGLTFPFFDGFRTQGKVAQAKSDISSLKIDEAKMLDSISLQIRDAVNGVREAGDIVLGLGGTVSQAQRLLDMAQKGYEYGVKTRLDVEDAELNLSRARGNLSRAYRDYRVARVNLTWSEGILGE